MLLIIAHHYVVNSGLTQLYDFEHITGNMIFLQLFGMFGKTVINCFTLITGYFMVTSTISVKKFVRIYLEVKFYSIIFYLIFLVTGHENFSLKGCIQTVLNVVYESGLLYTGTYIVFFLFLPFLNILARHMKKRQYEYLLVLSIGYFTIVSTFLKHETFDFLGWMMVVYLIGAYIRLYPREIFQSKTKAGTLLFVSILLMAASVLAVDYIGSSYGFTDAYYMCSNSNKFLALTCSISAFLFFKNIRVKQSRMINVTASSTFGILLIHANSDTMRRFLWQDVFENVSFYHSVWLFVHAVAVVGIVYVVCFILDQCRMNFIEKPVMSKLEQLKWFQILEKKFG